ncbi:hypothetical protein [Marinimicrobium agarilyticum]|uniref:hypothetical protein n=1 Tax=Marinimicrobium agarilyticum TaxID=306546 RepID=UPI00040A1E8F|nr:hypothetical protein [Marinimicrobium agarilyticum]
MNDADFELIMAYADGETGPEDTARAEALLAEQPEARATLKRLRAVDSQVKASLASVLDEPVPERLTRAASDEKPAGARVLRFPMKQRPSHWALAASLVLALGAVFFWRGAPGPNAEAMRTFVFQTLEQTPSGERRTHPKQDWQVMPLASYQTPDGRFCREYAGRTDSDTLAGLACRSTDGQWQTLVSEAQTPVEGYQPASGPFPQAAVVLQELNAGEPLSAEEEAALLNRAPD